MEYVIDDEWLCCVDFQYNQIGLDFFHVYSFFGHQQFEYNLI